MKLGQKANFNFAEHPLSYFAYSSISCAARFLTFPPLHACKWLNFPFQVCFAQWLHIHILSHSRLLFSVFLLTLYFCVSHLCIFYNTKILFFFPILLFYFHPFASYENYNFSLVIRLITCCIKKIRKILIIVVQPTFERNNLKNNTENSIKDAQRPSNKRRKRKGSSGAGVPNSTPPVPNKKRSPGPNFSLASQVVVRVVKLQTDASACASTSEHVFTNAFRCTFSGRHGSGWTIANGWRVRRRRWTLDNKTRKYTIWWNKSTRSRESWLRSCRLAAVESELMGRSWRWQWNES